MAGRAPPHVRRPQPRVRERRRAPGHVPRPGPGRRPRVGARGGPSRFAAVTDLDEHGRPEPPLAADETATLLGFLEYQRATLASKCAGLDSAGIRPTVAASS